MSLDLTRFEKAILSFERSLSDYQLAETTNNGHFLETLRAGVIQNFEFTYELTWKLMKRWLDTNLKPDATFAVTKKQLFRLAAENGLIADVEIWFEFQQSRNETSHTYAGDTAEQVFAKAKEFLPYAKNLLKCLMDRNE